MNVTLAPDLEEMVHQMVADGEYPSVSEVLNDALRLLILTQQDEARTEEELEELRCQIALGLEDFKRGAYTTLSTREEKAAFFEKIKTEGSARLAELEKESA